MRATTSPPDDSVSADPGRRLEVAADALAPLVVAVGLVAPLVAGVVAVAIRFDPAPATYGDGAILELAVREAARGERLLGAYSRFGWRHPGPAMFYWLAPFYVVAGQQPVGMMVGALVGNTLAMAAAVAVVARHAGRRAALWTTAVVLLLVAVFRLEYVLSFWNPQLVIVPMVLLGVLCAAAAAGSSTALAGAALVGSLAVQTHVGTAGAVLAWLAAALVLRRVMPPDAHAAPPPHPRRPLVTWSLVAATALVWVPPLVEEAVGDPGNVAELLGFVAAGTGGHGAAEAGRAVSWAATAVVAGLPPHADLGTAPGRGLVLAALLAAVAAATVVARRRGQAFACAAGLLALGGTAVSWVLAARIPETIYRYLLLWAAAPTALGLVAVGTVLARSPALTRVASAGVLALAVVLVAQAPLPCDRLGLTGLAGPSAACAAPGERTNQHLAREVARVLEDRRALRRPRSVLVSAPWWLAGAVVLTLDAAGHDVHVTDALVTQFGTAYAPHGDEAVVIRIVSETESATGPLFGHEPLGRVGDHVVYLHDRRASR